VLVLGVTGGCALPHGAGGGWWAVAVYQHCPSELARPVVAVAMVRSSPRVTPRVYSGGGGVVAAAAALLAHAGQGRTSRRP
jgi:hypothetical protein